MAITINYPTSGQAFGPGFLFRATASGTPDLFGDAYWQIDLTAPANELSMISTQISARSNPIEQALFKFDSADRPQAVVARPEWVTGKPAQLMVSLFDSDAAFVELQTVAVVLDRQAGQVAELANIVESLAATPPAGAFSDADRTSLQVVQASVTPQIGQGVINLLDNIGNLITHPPLSVGNLSTPPFELTGDGFIPVVVPKAIFGLYFLATTIPEGFGVLNGNSAEYQQRLVQFRTVHTVGGVELVTEIQDFHTHGQLWAWQIALPTRVEYSITPGVVLSVRWWQFP